MRFSASKQGALAPRVFIRPFKGGGPLRLRNGGGLAASGCVSVQNHLPPANGLLRLLTVDRPLSPHFPEQLPDVLLLVFFGHFFGEGDHVGGGADLFDRQLAVVEAFQLLFSMGKAVEDLQAPYRHFHRLSLFFIGREGAGLRDSRYL